MVHLDENTHLYEKLMDFAPQVVEKIQQMVNGNGSQNQTPTTEVNISADKLDL